MKTYAGVEVQLYALLTSPLDGTGQLHAPAAPLPQGKSPKYLLVRLSEQQSRSEKFT
jgi:hypothetical protein